MRSILSPRIYLFFCKRVVMANHVLLTLHIFGKSWRTSDSDATERFIYPRYPQSAIIILREDRGIHSTMFDAVKRVLARTDWWSPLATSASFSRNVASMYPCIIKHTVWDFMTFNTAVFVFSSLSSILSEFWFGSHVLMYINSIAFLCDCCVDSLKIIYPGL